MRPASKTPQSASPSEIDRTKKAGDGEKVPVPSDQAEKPGPFGGGKDGSLLGAGTERQQVQIPPAEEKILVRSVGSTDSKRYKNAPGARAKTGLGSAEFTKPKASVSESTQPIPVEYGDILQ